MRLVLDTNVVVSGLLWDGPPSHVIRSAIRGTVTLYTSPALLDELARVLDYPRLRPYVASAGLTPALVVRHYEALARVVHPPPEFPLRIRDADDAIVLTCAAAVQADAIVSGDHDVLSLRSFRGIPTLSAAEVLARIPKPVIRRSNKRGSGR